MSIDLLIPPDFRSFVLLAGQHKEAHDRLRAWAIDLVDGVAPFWVPAANAEEELDDVLAFLRDSRRSAFGFASFGSALATDIFRVGLGAFLGTNLTAYLACSACGHAVRGVVAVVRGAEDIAAVELYSAALMAASSRSSDMAPLVDVYVDALVNPVSCTGSATAPKLLSER